MTGPRTALARALPRGGFRRDVAVLLGGSVLGQLLVVAVTPLVSRLYRPDELGVFALFSSLESILVVVVCLRYEQAIAVAPDDERAGNLLGLSLVVVGVATTVLAAAGLAFAGPLSRAVGLEELRPYVVLLALALAGDAAYQTFGYWWVRRRDYALVAGTKVRQGLAQSAGQLGLGVAGAGPGGLLVGWTAGRAAGTLKLARAAWREGAFRYVSAAGMRRAAAESARFPVLTMPASLLNSASLQLPGLLLATVYDLRVAGLFLLATRVVTVPMTLLGQSVSQALMGRLAPSGGTIEPPAPLVRRTVVTLAALTAGPAAALVVAGPGLFAFVFGDEWRQAGSFARLLAPAFVAQLSVSPVAWVLVVGRRQGAQLAWDAARLVLVLAALLLPAASDPTGATSVGAYSAVLVVTYLALLAMVLATARRPARPASPAPEAAEVA